MTKDPRWATARHARRAAAGYNASVFVVKIEENAQYGEAISN